MAYVWIRDDFTSHPKIVQLTDAQLRIWLGVLCWAKRFQTDGIVQFSHVKTVQGLTPKRLQKFIELALLDEHENGWKIHDWDEYNGTRKQREQARLRKREQRQRHANVTLPDRDNVTPDDRDMSRSRATHARRTREGAELEQSKGVRSVSEARNELPPTSESNGNGRKREAEQPSITARYANVPTDLLKGM